MPQKASIQLQRFMASRPSGRSTRAERREQPKSAFFKLGKTLRRRIYHAVLNNVKDQLSSIHELKNSGEVVKFDRRTGEEVSLGQGRAPFYWVRHVLQVCRDFRNHGSNILFGRRMTIFLYIYATTAQLEVQRTRPWVAQLKPTGPGFDRLFGHTYEVWQTGARAMYEERAERLPQERERMRQAQREVERRAALKLERTRRPY